MKVRILQIQSKSKNESKNSSDSIWEYCLTIEVLDQPTNVTSVVYQDDVSTCDQNYNSILTLLNLILFKFRFCTLFFYSDANFAAPGDPYVYFTALDLGFDENEDFELTFDDLDAFEVDDFSLKIWIKLPIC